ncbi:MAG: DUF547 domain-containing protein [Candidatus Dadabacteria bacterium]|nr:DUF547 domain-containing protein [Candidatus Dadabacteria bacterium]
MNSMTRTAILLTVLVLAPTFSPLKALSLADTAQHFDHSHSALDNLLQNHVRDGRVDYKGFISSRKAFEQYINELGDADGSFSDWSSNEKLAFWINAYNAFTIKAIIDNYPIKKGFFISLYPANSIRQIDGVWDKLTFRAAGKTVTLNDIEHQILRKEFSEPRIHFAIVCASVGCPELRSEAYMADKVQEQLEQAARDFVNNPQKVLIDPEKRAVKLSKIFKWFGEDFIRELGTVEHFKNRNPRDRAVLNFVMTYIEEDRLKSFLEGNRFKVSYLKYDWSLNNQA